MYKFIHKPISIECSRCYKTFEPIIEWNETLDAPSSFIPNYCDECEEKMKVDTIKWKIEPHEVLTYYIAFNNKENKEIGKLDFIGDRLKFEGNVEESAKKFMDYLLMVFERKIDKLTMEAYHRGWNKE